MPRHHNYHGHRNQSRRRGTVSGAGLAAQNARLGAAIRLAEAHYQCTQGRNHRFSGQYIRLLQTVWEAHDPQLTCVLDVQSCHSFAQTMVNEGWDSWTTSPAEGAHWNALFSYQGCITVEQFMEVAENPSYVPPTLRTPAFTQLASRIEHALNAANVIYSMKNLGSSFSRVYRVCFERCWMEFDTGFTGTLSFENLMSFAQSMVATGWPDWNLTGVEFGALQQLATIQGGFVSMEQCHIGEGLPSTAELQQRSHSSAAVRTPSRPTVEKAAGGVRVVRLPKEEKRPAAMKAAAVEDSMACVVCMERAKCVAMLPCRHLAICSECHGDPNMTLDGCPICRAQIDDTVSVFI